MYFLILINYILYTYLKKKNQIIEQNFKSKFLDVINN